MIRNLVRRPWLAPVLHLCWIIPAIWGMSIITGTEINPGKFLNFDSGWYQQIMEKGYFYMPGQSNLAFFPAFPYLWKFSGLGPMGIALVNLALFTTTWMFLIKKLDLSFPMALVLSATPALMFMGAAYSESIFFLASTLIIVGFKEDRRAMLVIGFILAGLTRAVNVVFVPALLILGFYYFLTQGKSWSKQLTQISLALLASLAGILATAWIQYHQTGLWMYFSQAQFGWEKKLGLPGLPLTTWNAQNYLWMDIAAYLTGLAAGIMILILLFRNWFKAPWLTGLKKWQPGPEISFALLYLAGITLITLIFNVRVEGYRSSILSLNRYVFATAFFVVGCRHLFQHQPFSIRPKFLVYSLAALACLVFVAPGKESMFLMERLVYLHVAVALFLVYVYLNLFQPGIKSGILKVIIYLALSYIQVIMFLHYMKASFVG